MKSIYKITLLFLLIPLLSSAKNDDKKHEKSRTINKEFSVNENARLEINNKYGDLKITTWDKNQITIEVTITVKGDDLDRVEDKLETIDVDFDATSNYVQAKTRFEKEQSSWSFWKKSNNLNYKINYTVKMPKTNSVNLNNDYGSIFLDNLSGEAQINCDYGKISIGQLTASNNNINLDYCSSSTIGFMKSGDINLDYSKLTVDDSENIKLNSDYSTVKFDKAGNLNFNIDYGSISVNEIHNVDGNSDYASMNFGTVYNSLKIDTDYGGISIDELAKGFESVRIESEYAGIKIGVDPRVVFDFEFDLQYAGFKGVNDKMEFFEKTVKSSKKYYKGKFGTGNSNATITIKSQYGSVSIREN